MLRAEYAYENLIVEAVYENLLKMFPALLRKESLPIRAVSMHKHHIFHKSIHIKTVLFGFEMNVLILLNLKSRCFYIMLILDFLENVTRRSLMV